MKVSATETGVAWLLLTFTLPAKRASQRVEIWRKLQRYGAVALGNSGYLLPNNSATRERFEWLATAIRKYSGEASVVMVQSIDNLSVSQLKARFAETRAREYEELIEELQKLAAIPRHKHSSRLSRIRGRFREIVEVDFFNSPLQKRVDMMLARAESVPSDEAKAARLNPKDYLGRVWVTRPRPGIDRSASAWLIRCFIDKRARFIFAPEDKVPRDAVPFDMFHGRGFGHRGEDCTFETLRSSFRIRDRKAGVIAQIVHDADLFDEKFGRKEGFGIDAVLNGWAKQGMPDQELLERGMQLIAALYSAVSAK